MFCKVFATSLLVAVVPFGMASVASADITAQKDSADFAWKYEMSILPTAENLDGPGNTTPDFGYYPVAGDSVSTDGNVLRMVYSKAHWEGYYASDSPGQIWAAQGLNYAAGYTVEARVKVISMDSGATAAMQIGTSPPDSSNGGILQLSDTGVRWCTGTPWTNSTTDAFHVYRFAQKEGTNEFSVWRDGVALGTGLGGEGDLAGYPQIFFGGNSYSVGGTVDVDYLRFTAGAWAPVSTPEPSAIILLATGLVGLLAYAWRKRK